VTKFRTSPVVSLKIAIAKSACVMPGPSETHEILAQCQPMPDMWFTESGSAATPKQKDNQKQERTHVLPSHARASRAKVKRIVCKSG